MLKTCLLVCCLVYGVYNVFAEVTCKFTCTGNKNEVVIQGQTLQCPKGKVCNSAHKNETDSDDRIICPGCVTEYTMCLTCDEKDNTIINIMDPETGGSYNTNCIPGSTCKPSIPCEAKCDDTCDALERLNLTCNPDAKGGLILGATFTCSPNTVCNANFKTCSLDGANFEPGNTIPDETLMETVDKLRIFLHCPQNVTSTILASFCI